MRVSIIGSNGMLSVALAKYFYAKSDCIVDVYGLDYPNGYEFENFYQINLLETKLDYDNLLFSDVIIYASGAGVQAALSTDSSLMYALNVNIPIEITLQLKKRGYKGKYVSFGSYMEIGLNSEEGKAFTEDEVVCSELPITNDYGLSKRLYSRYMNELMADYSYLHFILPNMFSEEDKKQGTRLVPYTLNYLQDYRAGHKNADPCFSAGLQTRQFITLEEMTQTIDKTLEKNIPSGLYNIGGGEYLSIRSLIERLFAIYEIPCKDEFFGQEVRRDGDIKSLRIDGSKLYKEIGVLPSSTIEKIFTI
ncbi:MAG: NAD(P)-dependent oxidoreductase [Bacteroidaceae bacterium]